MVFEVDDEKKFFHLRTRKAYTWEYYLCTSSGVVNILVPTRDDMKMILCVLVQSVKSILSETAVSCGEFRFEIYQYELICNLQSIGISIISIVRFHQCL